MGQDKRLISAGGVDITLFAGTPRGPLAVLEGGHREGEKVYEACRRAGCGELSLACVEVEDWNRDLSPWASPAVMKNGESFPGGADAYLRRLSGDILPALRSALGWEPAYILHAGYSLAGLFVLYSGYRTALFQKLVCASGSLWYRDFLPFMEQNELNKSVSAVYFSLGEKEAKTRNPILAAVREKTERARELVAAGGADTAFVLQPGGHFAHGEARLAEGICWCLRR